jgi:hypothetical protein
MQTELHRLQADSLAQLDRGALGVAMEKAIHQAANDCVDRPADDRARVVTVQIELKPKAEFDNDTRSIEIVGAEGKYKVKCKVPDYESKPLDFGLQTDGTLIFNESIPDNHRARSLPFGDDEE